MHHDHPNMMSMRQLRCNANGSLHPWKWRKPLHAKPPPYPEADDIAREAADPADRNQCAEIQDARMRRIAGKQRKQKGVRGRKAKHDAIGRVAVLANEVKERREICRKQQWGTMVGVVISEAVQNDCVLPN
jgi:hypothetical protein